MTYIQPVSYLSHFQQTSSKGKDFNLLTGYFMCMSNIYYTLVTAIYIYISIICYTAMLTQFNINAARYFYYDMISWTMDNIGVYPF